MMKKTLIGVVCAVLGGAALYAAQGMPQAAEPQKEHKWLQQFVGEWTMVCDLTMGSDQPTMQSEGTESARAIGELWIVSEVKGTVPGGPPLTAMLTLGYDPEKGKYVGNWIDSMTAYLWHYEGSVDAAGKVLTLNTEGPNIAVPGSIAKYRDVHEFKGPDRRVLTSSMLGEDGAWQTFMTANYHRVK